MAQYPRFPLQLFLVTFSLTCVTFLLLTPKSQTQLASSIHQPNLSLFYCTCFPKKLPIISLNLPIYTPFSSSILIINIFSNKLLLLTHTCTPPYTFTNKKNSLHLLPLSFMASSLLIAIVFIATLVSTTRANFYNDFAITWGDGRANILNTGNDLTLSLDKSSGSGFQSKNEYLFGKIDMQIKLVPGNSAGTVTAYYLSSMGPTHDEIDFEFLGNVSGQPYTLHTNVFAQGKGNREQQFHLWFDPTKDFHTYSILWNPRRIVFSVDGTPIREHKNMESNGIPFPKNQPMRIYSSLWNAEDWATQGGRIKTDWTQAPFTASYRNFKADACVWASGSSSCGSGSSPAPGSDWLTQELDSASQERMKWAQKNYMIYNYCADVKRFPQGLPQECTATS